MKKLLLIFSLVFTVCSYSQIQIGSNIFGKNIGHSGHNVSLSDDGSVVAIGEPGFISGTPGAVHIYENINGIWTQLGSSIVGLPGEFIGSIGSVSLSDDGSVVAVGSDQSNNQRGIVRIYKYRDKTKDGTIINEWIQVGGYISGSAPGEFLGRTVNLSGDGNTIAIGVNIGFGAVYIYKNVGGDWSKMSSDIEGKEESFGSSINLSDDGNVIVVGSPFSDINRINGGVVRVYKNTGNVWTQLGFNILGKKEDELLGWDVSLSDDGSVLAIVGGLNINFHNTTTSIVRIYKNTDDVWAQVGSDIIEEKEEEAFGHSISLSADGSIIAIGSPYSNNGSNLGNVRIYKNKDNVWTQKSSIIKGSGGGEFLGWSVNLSSDGNILAVGAVGGYGYTGVYNLSGVLSSDSFVLENTSMYPNPTNKEFTVRLSENIQFKKLRIYTTLGKYLLESSKKEVNIESLSKGLYFVEITTDQGKATKKLLVN